MEIIERKDGLLYVGLMPSELTELQEMLSSRDNVILGLDVMKIYADEDILLKDLKVLNELDLKRISINAPGNINHQALYDQTNLIHLDMRCFDVESFDFKYFPQLQYLYFDWKKGILNIDRLHNLRIMVVRGYKPIDKCLSLFSHLKHLNELHLVQSTVSSLKGIEEIESFHDLSIVYCRNLSFSDSIVYPHVKSLYIENCKKVGLEFVNSFPNLQTLHIQSQSGISSLKPLLDGLKQLEVLKVYGTRIEESDNAYWGNYKQLKHIEFQDFRHYKINSKGFIKRHSE